MNKGAHYTNWHAAIQGAGRLIWRLLVVPRRAHSALPASLDSALEKGLLISITIYFLWANASLTKVLGRRYNERL